jgi:hypothetical protein
MDEALAIRDYFPNSFKNPSDGEYIAFLWDAFESNYQHGKYQFAMLACHMLYMSFVYFSVWQIKLSRPDDYKKAAVFLANRKLAENDLLGASSPFTLSKLEERTIFRLLRLTGCEGADVKPFAQLVDERNEIAHSNGNIFYNDKTAADRKIAEFLTQMEAIQGHLRAVLHECFGKFLCDSYDPENREYVDDTDQIREALIHENYFSQKDIEACLSFDIDTLAGHESFLGIKALFDAFVQEYQADVA